MFASGCSAPKSYTCETSILGSSHDSTRHLIGVTKTTSFSACNHKRYDFVAEGFKITSFTAPNIVEIHFYDQHFCTTTGALGATWAGRSILVRGGYWYRLLRTGCRQSDHPFRLRRMTNQTGFLIEGTCYGRGNSRELEDCWEGEILLAEDDGGWSRLLKYVQMQFIRSWIGRHRSRHQRERYGIMHKMSDSDV